MSTPKEWKNEKGAAGLFDAAALIELEERLQRGINAKNDYGAKGDGVTDDATALQNALNAAALAGGGIVFLPRGTYIVGTTITVPANVRLEGAGWMTTILKAKNSSNIVVLEGANYATTGTKNGAIEHLAIDGNKANNSSTVGLKFQSQNFYFNKVIALNCNGHGFDIKLSTETEQQTVGLDNCLESCRAIGCEDRGFNIEAHDTLMIDCQAIQCKEYGFYWATNGYMINCHSWCYDSTLASATKTGYRLATSVHCVDCIAEGATERQVLIAGNVVGWSGGEVFNGASKPNAALFEFNGGASARILDPWCHEFGTGGAFKFTTNGEASIIRARCFDSGGNQVTQGSPAEDIRWDLALGGGTTLGGAAYTSFKQLTLSSFTPGTVPNKTLYLDTTTGRLRFKDGIGATRDLAMNGEEEVASANTISVSARVSYAKVTGTTEIKKINPTYAGHVLALRFTGTLIVKQGENLSNLPRDLETQAGVILTLFCDGTNWYEMSRQEGAAGGTVASASTISIKNYAKNVKVSGTAEVKKINATYNGHTVTIITTETAKFIDGENLKLKENFTGTADDTLTLTCDGTNWFEVGRSAN